MLLMLLSYKPKPQPQNESYGLASTRGFVVDVRFSINLGLQENLSQQQLSMISTLTKSQCLALKPFTFCPSFFILYGLVLDIIPRKVLSSSNSAAFLAM